MSEALLIDALRWGFAAFYAGVVLWLVGRR